jgi:Leucine-rich repeat (LRR) protein
MIVNLDNNLLTDLPHEVGNWSRIGAIFADNNPFTSIPEELANLLTLRALTLSNNKLSYEQEEYYLLFLDLSQHFFIN